MSSRKVLSRLAAATATATAVGAAVLALFAAPAYAEDAVDVDINGLASGMAAGDRPDAFAIRMQNRTKAEIQPIRRTFVIRLEGLPAEAVRMTRGHDPLPASGFGEVQVIDGLNVRLGPDGRSGDSVTTAYTIQFAESAPGGRATVTVTASVGPNVLGSHSQTITVKGGRGAATPSQSSVATEAGGVPTFETGPSVSIAPLTEDKGLAGSEGGIPFAFYVVGALLVGAGGVILWLLFRPRRGLVGETAVGYEPASSPLLGYPTPRHAAPEIPTAAFPHVSTERYAPPTSEPPPATSDAPPAFDPWALPANPPAPTREFPPPGP
jgi:hypothetical protein